MNRAEKQLLAHLQDRVHAFDYADEMPNEPVAIPSGNGMGLSKIPGNPSMKAQFDINLLVRFYSVAAGVYTSLTPAALLAAEPTLATQLAAFVFNQSDFAGGFRFSQSQFPLSGWAYDFSSFIYGNGYPVTRFGVLDATALAALQVGDLVIPYYASVGGTDYVALVIVRCRQVSYGKLLQSLGSNRFWINNIRYNIDTTTYGEGQFLNSIFLLNQTMFGKYGGNDASPNSFKMPTQFQGGIIDVPIKTGFDKHAGLGTYIDYNTTSFLWSIFVPQFDQLKA